MDTPEQRPEVKVGDLFARRNHHCTVSLWPVTRVLPSRVECGSTALRWARGEWREVGQGRNDHSTWSLATQADLDEVTANRLRARLHDRIDPNRGGPLTLDQLRRIAAIVDES